jgi:hypothetical protein
MPENGCRLGCGEACPTPPDGDATCGTDGRCTFDCEPPFRREGDECVCTPRTCEDAMYMCGELDDGCGTPLDCGSCGTGDCIDGTCRCSPDGHEANDSSTTAPNLGSFDDSDDPDDFILSDGTIDEMGDVDWYRFSITDGTDFGNPRLTVTLDQIPMGANYDVAAFYTCGGGSDASTCSMGTVDNTLGHGCAASASGTTAETVEIETECDHLSTDDGGSLYVRVRAASWAGQCAAYRLTLRVR